MQLTEARRPAAPPAAAPFIPAPGEFSAGVVASLLSGGATFDQHVALEKQRAAAADRDQRERNREQEQVQSDHAAAAAAAPTTAERVQEAERSMAPGSRAARDAARREHAAQAAGRATQPSPAPEHPRAQNQAGDSAYSTRRSPPTGPNAGPDKSAAPAQPVDAVNLRPTATLAMSPAEPAARAGPAVAPQAYPPSTGNTLSPASGASAPAAASPPASSGGQAPSQPVAAVQANVEASAPARPDGTAARADASPTGAAARTLSRAESAAGKAAASPSRENDAQENANLERIVRHLRAQITHERARTSLRLDPPELGRIRMQMELEHDQMRLVIDTQTHLAHHVLRETLDSLRAELATCGIHLAHVELRPPEALPDDGAPGGFGGDPGQEAGASADHGAAQGGAFAESFEGAPDLAAVDSATARAASGEEALPATVTASHRNAAEPRVNVWA